MVDDLLERIVETYSSCASYCDRGTVNATDHGPSGAHHVAEMTFRTAFRRPDKFKFEFHRRPGGRGVPILCVVWTDGPRIRLWWTAEPEVREFASLDSALAFATGISMGVAYLIPRLLRDPKCSGRFLLDHLSWNSTMCEEVHDGRVCRVLSTKGFGATGTSIRLDMRTMTVRKIVRRSRSSVEDQKRLQEDVRRLVGNDRFVETSPIEERLSETVLDYTPELHPILDERAFQFEPPV